jgi:hypothetical protein
LVNLRLSFQVFKLDSQRRFLFVPKVTPSVKRFPTITTEQLAQSAYEAYGYNRAWKDYRGNPMPQWDTLPRHIQVGWMAAVTQVKSVLEHSDALGNEDLYKNWSPPDAI